VAVLSTHRRQGHLTRLMQAQLAQVAEQGNPVAILISADWPIYGRYGYGPATEACAWEVDATTPMTSSPTGEIRFTDRAGARAHIDTLHDAMGRRRPGVITRSSRTWDVVTGIEPHPAREGNPGLERVALWHDGDGEVRGLVRYRVEERWERNRARSRAIATELFATDNEAERELWRHLLSIDWVTTVRGEHRPVDDPIPLWLGDGRAAAQRDRYDHVWVRLLDVPAALRARTAGAPADVVIEVVDDGGPAAGRWRLTGEPGAPIHAVPAAEAAELRLPAASLGAAYLGGVPATRLADGGWLDEHAPGAAARLGALLGWSAAPWVPTQF
jgi:predicted acetyltransferase